MIEGDITA